MSIISTIKNILGQSATAGENHFIDGSVANKLSIKRGTPASPGAEVLKIDAGVVSFPQNPVEPKIIAWAKLTSTGASNPTVNGSYGLASIIRTSTGQFTATFSATLTDANYAVSGLCAQAGVDIQVTAQSTSGFNFATTIASTGAYIDQNAGFLLNLTVVK